MAATASKSKRQAYTIKEKLGIVRREQIYNCDETGLYYKLLPDKNLGTKEDKQTGFKSTKQRVTVLLKCNKPGTHKLKPLVIGSAQNPRHTVKDAVLQTDKALMKVTPATINNCWMKGLGPAFRVDEDFMGFQEDVTDAVRKYRDYAKENSIDVSPETATGWNTCDDNLPIAELLNDQELVAAAMPVEIIDDEEDENSDDESVQPMAPSVRDAINGAECLL
ncbi:uncharacterized protein LOC125377233 [Haliotis rufescens]|uniref:uncharacterized protein LOC125377233 n=1 Tax=Haliotis rufescens TaxID=6454 RepID=UPI00201ED3DD|nr:uncharacterized protein LOC125377233 [Haliotis rufescens]